MKESLTELQLHIYNSSPNYEIEFTSDTKECVAIYFTSHNLFFPHNVESFRKSVIEKKHFEWKNNRVIRAGKHIFLRDVYKQWYASGINDKINSIEKLAEWLTQEVQGYKEVICLGSSGGGYAATLIGNLISATTIFNFNGQWSFYDQIERDGIVISPLIKQMIENHHEGQKYFSISKELYDNTNTYYFVSSRSQWDKEQLQLIEHFQHTHIIRFFTSHHGIPFLKSTLPYIINMKNEELNCYEEHINFPILFDVHIAGIKATLGFVLRLINKKLKQPKVSIMLCSHML